MQSGPSYQESKMPRDNLTRIGEQGIEDSYATDSASQDLPMFRPIQTEHLSLDLCSSVPNLNAELLGVLPKLRVFAISLCASSGARVERAEDLVQQTVMKALANIHLFTPG